MWAHLVPCVGVMGANQYKYATLSLVSLGVRYGVRIGVGAVCW